ncbi:hypothetical protein [Owenweeksia hongkongensis]|uniref:hypothetical protein n=1 Tax=Owenweeksia hongkongensis TaxID=253245 RepID=UPI003A8E24C4
MKFTYTISSDDQLILARIQGSVGFVFFRQSLLYVWNHPLYKPEYNTIVDLSEANVNLRTLEISALIEMLVDRKARFNSKFTLIVTKPFEAALAMIFESKLVQSMPTKTFTNIEDAAQYVGSTKKRIEHLCRKKPMEVPIGDVLNFAVK